MLSLPQAAPSCCFISNMTPMAQGWQIWPKTSLILGSRDFEAWGVLCNRNRVVLASPNPPCTQQVCTVMGKGECNSSK